MIYLSLQTSRINKTQYPDKSSSVYAKLLTTWLSARNIKSTRDWLNVTHLHNAYSLSSEIYYIGLSINRFISLLFLLSSNWHLGTLTTTVFGIWPTLLIIKQVSLKCQTQINDSDEILTVLFKTSRVMSNGTRSAIPKKIPTSTDTATNINSWPKDPSPPHPTQNIPTSRPKIIEMKGCWHNDFQQIICNPKSEHFVTMSCIK